MTTGSVGAAISAMEMTRRGRESSSSSSNLASGVFSSAKSYKKSIVAFLPLFSK
jgi:hypothetical protein